ncbi:virulence metalloprotease [Aplysia californica]|uniref:Virulence metalloprotease n=1 Tax=Aplysia californica TaxID=6500 RepID=A0ABM1A1U4_APLCA|nr:virulence metalloprotease [Aplysia californica]
MNLFLAFVTVGVVAVASYDLREIHKTPGVQSVERVIERGQEITGLDELSELLGLPSDVSLKIEQSRPTSHGLIRNKIRLLYKDIPVQVFTIQATSDANGQFTGAVSGTVPTSLSVDTSAKVKTSKLRSKTAEYTRDTVKATDPVAKQLFGKIKTKDLKECSFSKQIYINIETGEPSLAYYGKCLIDIALSDKAYVRTPRVIIDANTLSVLDGSIELRRHSGIAKRDADGSKKECPAAAGGNGKIHGPSYGPGPNEACLNVKVDGDVCSLQSDRIIVKTVKNQYNRELAEVVTFNCADGLGDAINGASSPSADAFFYGQRFYDLMFDWAGVENIANEPHVLNVHYGINYNNAFWDGFTSSFGDGTETLYPFTVREVIGHELCHAFTDSLNNLMFDAESIAIDESYSDICGKALSVFSEGDVGGWKFGANLKKENGEVLRHFDTPNADGSNIGNVNDFNPDSPETTSKGQGVFNKMFYELVENQKVAFRVVFELITHANLIYWQEQTSFLDGSCGVLRAAGDIGVDTDAVKNAFSAVGIDLKFCDLEGTKDEINEDTSRSGVVVSKDKNPKFTIAVPAGSSGFSVEVTGGQTGITVSLLNADDEEITSGVNSLEYKCSGSVTLQLSNMEDCDSNVVLYVNFN